MIRNPSTVTPGEELPAKDAPLKPLADIGVLLVHGIGNHLEGETLTAFGQPLLDWLKEWLHGKRGEETRGDVVVRKAQFKDDEAPAYALAHIDAPSQQTPGSSDKESWLFCEGWWGATVQPPPSLQLLRWMWTRGPLLVYWHFYIRAREGNEGKRKPIGLIYNPLAFFLAGFCQAIVSVAIVLWLIPIGPWRRKVVAAVQALTLTLGDSYVLEQDIQRAALAERIRRALEWLAERSSRVVVIAHSQGGAIAHEVLKRHMPAKLKMFVSVGSGLEKLHFLRAVVTRRDGLVAASLLFPLAALGGALALTTLGSTAEHWQAVLARTLLASAFALYCVLTVKLGRYDRCLMSAMADLELPPLGRDEWVDLYASEDVVPMNKGSMLNGASFLTRKGVYNERSYVRDHVAYFTNVNDCLPRLWENLARLSRLRLFDLAELSRLQRFSDVHKAYARLVYLSRIGLFLALLSIAFVLRNSLLSFSGSVLDSVKGTPVEEWLKPVRALAGGLAWIVQHLWKPAAVTADDMANGLFSGLVLAGAMALWWIIFRALWLWRCLARGRQACRGDDLIWTPQKRIWFVVSRAVFLGFGCVPLIVAIILATAPGLLTISVLGPAIAKTLAGGALMAALIFAAGGPLMSEGLWDDPKATRSQRVWFPVLLAFLVLMLLILTRWLWPDPVAPSVQNGFVAAFATVMALAWSIFALLWLRKNARQFWVGLIVAGPLLVAAFWFLAASALPFRLAAMIYFALTALIPSSAFCIRETKFFSGRSAST